MRTNTFLSHDVSVHHSVSALCKRKMTCEVYLCTFACQTRKDPQNSNNPMYKHNLVLKKRLLSLSPSSSRVIGLLIGLSKVVRQVVRSISLHEVSYCLVLLRCSLLLHCPCFAHCRHDSIIVRTASNFSTFRRYHSVCASVSMFMINIDNCLFQFLCSCLQVCSLGVTFIISSQEVFVRLYRGCNPATESIMDFISLHLVVECGIHGLIEYQSCKLNNIAVLKQ